jgi:SAM-dependent methyltransferase
VSGSEVARRVAALYPTRFLRAYVRWKIASDAVYQHARGPILDLGCGAGVMAAYLRARGYEGAIAGVDHDARKIEVARALALPGVTFKMGDASSFDLRNTIVMLDLLHYFDDARQRSLLEAVSGANLIIIRDAVRDGTWRYRATYAQETFARGVRWLKAERLNFPRRETIVGAFPGFESEVVPLWGRTPFNNYLFVCRRPSSGMTKE